MLVWITRHGVVSPEQLAQRFFTRPNGSVGLTVAYERFRKLDDLRLIDRNPPVWYRGPKLITVTKVGANIADLGLAPAPVSMNSVTMKHALAVVDLTEDLLHEYPAASVITERELRRDDQHARKSGARRNRDTRFPDAILRFKDEQSIAIELDLSHKSVQRQREKVVSFLNQPGLHVWWYCSTGEVYREVRRAVDAERADDRIRVRQWRH
jgi:hypothetical protein